MSQLSLGVGFVALFAPYKHSHVWFQYYDRLDVSSADQWNHFNLADEVSLAVVKQVCCGQGHMIALATSGEGTSE